MNQTAEELYQNLLLELDHCKKCGLGELSEVECMFTVSNKHWETLKQQLENHQFETVNEEIKFFKTLKPKFRAKSIYCGLISHALLFKSGFCDPAILEKFWHNEMLRLGKFISANKFFCNYYLSGRTDKDEEWFTRKRCDNDNIYLRSLTSHDHLISNLLALQEYLKYVENEKIKEQ